MILPIIAIRLVMIAFGFVAVALFAPQYLSQGVEMWNVWDSRNFLGVAAHGYGPLTSNPEWIVLFPGFPIALAVASLVLPGFTAGMLVSLIAALAAGLGLYALVRLDGSTRLARLSVLFMVIFPTAYSLVAPYSEGLFLALTLWAFIAVRKDHMATAGILGALAALTRIQGAFLIPALGIEYLMVRRRISWDFSWILFVGTGLVAYLGLNQYYFGNAMYFMDVQRDLYHVHNQLPWITFQNLWNGLLEGERGERWITLNVAPLGTFLLLLVVMAWTAFSKHSRPSYLVYVAISFLSFATLSWPISVPRYVMGVFPIFVALASWSRWAIGQALVAASLLLLGSFTALFLMRHWAF